MGVVAQFEQGGRAVPGSGLLVASTSPGKVHAPEIASRVAGQIAEIVIGIEPDHIEGIVDEKAMHAPNAISAQSELPRLRVVRLVLIDPWCLNETKLLSGLLEVNYVSAIPVDPVHRNR